ncbi:MAG: MATE family efflux transporter [Myxococcota bacterium]|nr:MATE family efflux transporter [Myxococcota bacterium]
MAADSSDISRRLVSLALPVIGLNVLNVLALTVDTIMIGHIPNSEVALTGLGFAVQILFLLMVAMIGLTVGTVALVARAHGARDPDAVNHTFAQSVQLTVLLSVVVAVAGNLLCEPILRLLGAGPESIGAGRDYLHILLTGVVFNYLNILLIAVMRGVGNTRLPFFVALLMNLLNAALNYGLILGNYGMPALGIQGAAIGTLVAQAFAVVMMAILIKRGRVPGLSLPMRLRAIDRVLAQRLVGIGTPAAMDMVVFNAGFLSIIGMLGHIDEIAVAAHGIGLRVQALAFVPGMSIGQATAAMVGNALGAKKTDEARATARSAMVLCAVIMTALGMIFIVGASPMLTLFDIQPGTPLAAYSITWIRLLGICMPLVSIYIALGGVFQGSGSTRIPLRINIIATVAQVPMSALLGFGIGLGALGVWAAFPMALAMKSVMGFSAYRKNRWLESEPGRRGASTPGSDRR